jgi:tRNA pseudouridine55 synthase
MGTLAHLTSLRRVQVDPFDALSMVTLDRLEALAATGLPAIDGLLIPSDQALGHLLEVEFDHEGAQSVLRGQNAVGQSLMAPKLGEFVRMYDPNRLFLGIGEVAANDAIQPRRLFVKSATGL